MLSHEEVELGSFIVIGPAILTSNEKELGPEGQMIELYEHFIHRNISEKIPNKKDDRVIAVYTDYEDEESGEYIYGLGHQVSQAIEVPGLEIFEIPRGKYLKFTSERGYLNDVLPRLWQEIWRRTQSGELGAERAYETDLEFHNYEDNTDSDVVVDVYLSIR